jgi:hypothetical protein
MVMGSLSLTSNELFDLMVAGRPPVVIDVRRRPRFEEAASLLPDDDHEALERGFSVYDALYAWANIVRAETRNWPAAKSK